MNPTLFCLLLLCGEGPTIVFDSRPDRGVPPEASAQKIDRNAAVGRPIQFRAIIDDTIKTVRIRYFNKATWAKDEEASKYLAGFLADTSLSMADFQVWSQVVGRPEIECVVEFSDDHLKKLREQNKPYQREGRLLIWNTEACFRDSVGRWWFLYAFDYFHSTHPNGNRELVKAPLPRPGNIPRLLVGKWNVEFANGVAEKSEIREDGTANVVEPLRSSSGKVAAESGSFRIRFEDNRVERWTPVGNRMIVEHWFPGAQYGEGKPVFGIADRAQ